MDDIFSKATSEPDAFEAMTEEAPRKTFSKKENYWDKTDIVPTELDVTKFKRKGKSFVIYVHPDNNVPADAAEKITKLAGALISNGYTFRHTGNADSHMQNAIRKIEDAKVVSFIPWKKFNPDIDNPVLPNPLGYQIALTIHKAYMRLPSAVRAILARDVNAITGPEATDPVDFIITWSDGGDEVISRKTDFKKLGNNTFILMLAKRANIPVLNVYNPGFIEKFKELVK